MIVFPNAKINIGLHVVAGRADGLHNLETVFYPLRFTDALEMAETGITGLTLSGIPIDCPSDENLVLKAYNLLKRDFGLPAVQFHLYKIIPFGGGLGGGSSDAAFTLKLLNDYFDLQLDSGILKKYAVKIGADCPFFIENKPVFAQGIGDSFSPISIDLSEYRIAILKPACSVNTQQAYKNVVASKPSFDLKSLADLPVEKWKGRVVNDFEKSVFRQYPEIKKLKDTLYDLGALYACMSGSGSVVFGIFRNVPDEFFEKTPEDILFTS